MNKHLSIFIVIALVIAAPFCVRRKASVAEVGHAAQDKVVIITPHNESIRFELGYGFKEWYYAHTGRTVYVDWRVTGSTGEVIKNVDSSYVNAFKLHRERKGEVWNQKIRTGFLSDKSQDPEVQAARREFLHSDVSCGIDILFGGGVAEFVKEANMGQLAPCHVGESCPEFFQPNVIPEVLGGERLWDKDWRWVGSTLTNFGIGFNRNRLKQLGFSGDPTGWDDVADPRVFGQVAAVDPSKSSAVITTMEMLIQQKMQARYKAAVDAGLSVADAERAAVREGWLDGMRVIQRISANARYFSDNSARTTMDLDNGNCAIGLLLDFYARAQIAASCRRGGDQRFGFIVPKGGACPSPDPIAILRGAPNPKVAELFVQYILSIEGQKVIDFKVGAPGGPIQYPLNRSPMRRDICEDPRYAADRIDPNINPFRDAEGFDYHSSWTKPVYPMIRFVSKVAFIDAHTELVQAWGAIIRAQKEGRTSDAERALAIFNDLSVVDYEQVSGSLKTIVMAKNPIKDVHIQTQLTNHFRVQFQRARLLANGGK